MSGETDLIKLYSGQILALAADIPHVGRLDSPDATAKRRSPQCGSSVTVDVQVEDGRLIALGQDVKACALGQAAAAVAGHAVVGMSLHDIRRGRDELFAMLKGSGKVPAAPFERFEVLIPAAGFANRHASIMLSLEAIVEAMEQADAEINVSQL